MKTLLLSLLLAATAARADQWLVDGRTYNGTLHKFNADRTLVYVTSDWDNYGGSWIKVSSLDAATRVRLNVATPQEQAAVLAAQEELRQLNAQALAQAQATVAADRAALLSHSSSPVYAAPVYPQTVYPAHSSHHHHHHVQASRFYVPQVHIVTPHVPQVGRPIIVRIN